MQVHALSLSLFKRYYKYISSVFECETSQISLYFVFAINYVEHNVFLESTKV